MAERLWLRFLVQNSSLFNDYLAVLSKLLFRELVFVKLALSKLIRPVSLEPSQTALSRLLSETAGSLVGYKRTELIPASEPTIIAMETHHYNAGWWGSCLRNVQPADRP